MGNLLSVNPHYDYVQRRLQLEDHRHNHNLEFERQRPNHARDVLESAAFKEVFHGIGHLLHQMAETERYKREGRPERHNQKGKDHSQPPKRYEQDPRTAHQSRQSRQPRGNPIPAHS